MIVKIKRFGGSKGEPRLCWYENEQGEQENCTEDELDDIWDIWDTQLNKSRRDSGGDNIYIFEEPIEFEF